VKDLSIDEKRDLLARLLRERQAREKTPSQGEDPGSGNDSWRASAPSRFEPIDRGSGGHELSFGQERIWFLEQLQPESLFYNVIERFGFYGQLDVELLRRSIAILVDRHEILRTVYPAPGGQPTQKVQPPESWTFRFIDLRGSELERREKEARDLITAEAKTPFDLAVGPLLRTTVLQLNDLEFVLAVTVHHIAIDGWSLRLFVHELAQHYQALKTSGTTVYSKDLVQYADFANWQRRWFKGEVLGKQRAYWLDQLGKNPPTLDLPTDYGYPATRTFEGTPYYSVISPETFSRLRELGRDEGVTLFTLLLAAFSVLLMRYSAQEDFVLGSLAAGRLRPEVEKSLGFFANTLAFRLDLSGNPTFREAVARAREVVAGANENEAFPFEKLVEMVKPERGRANNPLAQVFINMLNFWKRDEIVLPELRIRPLGGFDIHCVADAITLFVSVGHEHVDLCYVYGTELFARETIERMASHFLALLSGIVANPEAHIWALPLLPQHERESIEKMSTRVDEGRPVDVTLHELFEAQVRERPHAIAVSCGDTHLSYAELDKQASKVAGHLKAMGASPDTIVGLCTDRSLDLVIGLLGILKSGCGYVPLDPRDPEDRLSFILSDTQAQIVVTHRAAEAAFPAMSGMQRLMLDDALSADIGVSVDCEVGRATPDNLAYVIYTSGSTGRPKGVPVTHANVVRLLRSTEAWFAFGPRDIWTLFHSFAFDFSVWELWGALAYGGRLIVVPYIVSRDPQAFLTLLARERVTVLNQTPSAFRSLMEADRIATPEVFLSLRVVIFGGEALELQSLRAWVERHGDAQPRLVNMYGITETCVHVTYRPITRDDIESKRGSVIGIPIPDLRIRLCDSYGDLVPFGVPGEIYVGGPGLARGYLNRPELTAQRFISDPSCPTERLYRSGDLARRFPNGELEYLGRIDQQVKIRGFRIEIGEIESALAEHPAVREAIVVVQKISGENTLVAYVVLSEGDGTATEFLREHLRKKLPSYMLPQAIEVLSSLPLNRNGKVDRDALPAPTSLSTGGASSPPRTPTEQSIAALWEEVLQIENIGSNDNFFERGGQSLLAVRVMSKLRQALGIELPVSRLFELQTVAGLAAWIDGVRNAGAPANTSDLLPTLKRVPRDSVRRIATQTEEQSEDHP